MTGEGSNREQYKIILYLFVAWISLLAIGGGVRSFLDDAWLTVVDIAVTGVLSLALVFLYFRQTRTLESQKELLTRELNREARQQHTEVLRERVRTWHGDPDHKTVENTEDSVFNLGQDLNLPRVLSASFESAPTGPIRFAGHEEEEQFRVVPHQLEGDRYLEDLLQNHAPDLRKTAEEITQIHKRFTSLRNDFIQEYDGNVVEKPTYTLEPVDYLARWIFEFIVMRERGFLEDQEALVDRALRDLESGETNIYEEGSRIWVQPDVGGGGYRAIYGAVMETHDREELNDHRQDAKEDVTEIVKDLLEEIDDGHPYKIAHEASEILNDAEGAVDELEHTLIEYDGRPIYQGDCKYLQEAMLE